MMHSMTGFGDAQAESVDWAYHLELRSVNNRYFKSSIHLPDELSFLEPELERRLRAALTRGTVSVRLHRRATSARSAPEINLSALRHFLDQLAPVLAALPQARLDPATLALLPGMVQPHDLTDEERDAAGALVLELLEAALGRLVDMRNTEGAALAGDLRQHCEGIRTRLSEIRTRAPRVVEEYRDRLLTRIRQLLTGSGVELGAQDLLREVAVYADRSDISEEITRLGGHIDQFLRFMDAPEPAGRKLEFIAQEMLREANTMGSKTGDAEIAGHIIEIKSAVDRIKEQVANVE